MVVYVLLQACSFTQWCCISRKDTVVAFTCLRKKHVLDISSIDSCTCDWSSPCYWEALEITNGGNIYKKGELFYLINKNKSLVCCKSTTAKNSFRGAKIAICHYTSKIYYSKSSHQGEGEGRSVALETLKYPYMVYNVSQPWYFIYSLSFTPCANKACACHDPSIDGCIVWLG